MNYLQTIALLEMVCITFQYKVYNACLTSSDIMDSFYYVECIDDMQCYYLWSVRYIHAITLQVVALLEIVCITYQLTPALVCNTYHF